MVQHNRDNVGKFERHIERKNEHYGNMNVDLSRTPMNVHYRDCGGLTYNQYLDKLVEDSKVSLRGLKKDAKVYDELIFDVNTYYFEKHGGYEFAKRFCEEAEKEIKWSKRCKDKSLVGTVKETVQQVSHSKKWKSPQAVNENGELKFNKRGKPVLIPS